MERDPPATEGDEAIPVDLTRTEHVACCLFIPGFDASL
jgi:hypothetical protein